MQTGGLRLDIHANARRAAFLDIDLDTTQRQFLHFTAVGNSKIQTIHTNWMDIRRLGSETFHTEIAIVITYSKERKA
jgi:hypothetical protein